MTSSQTIIVMLASVNKIYYVSKGVSLIELLLVIALIAILGTASSPFLSSFIQRNNYETTADKLLSTLRKAQGYSMSGRNQSAWGVCLTAENKIRLYRGSCSAPDFSEDFDVPNSITITGLSDTTFSVLRGEPSQELTIAIETDIDSRTVSVNGAGMIEVN